MFTSEFANIKANSPHFGAQNKTRTCKNGNSQIETEQNRDEQAGRRNELHERGDPALARRLPPGLPDRQADQVRVFQDLSELLPERRSLCFRRVRLQRVRREQRRQHRVLGVYHRALADFARQLRGETRM